MSNEKGSSFSPEGRTNLVL